MEGLGHGGGLVVRALAYCSEDPSSNPASYCIFIVDKDKNKQKEAEVGPFKKKFVQDNEKAIESKNF